MLWLEYGGFYVRYQQHEVKLGEGAHWYYRGNQHELATADPVQVCRQSHYATLEPRATAPRCSSSSPVHRRTDPPRRVPCARRLPQATHSTTVRVLQNPQGLLRFGRRFAGGKGVAFNQRLSEAFAARPEE